MQEPTLLDRATGALLGAFVGDALGMPYEGRPGAEIPDRVEMIDGRAPAGTYTDDTQMMIALAESLIRCGKVDPDDLARAFPEFVRAGAGGTVAALSRCWGCGAQAWR